MACNLLKCLVCLAQAGAGRGEEPLLGGQAAATVPTAAEEGRRAKGEGACLMVGAGGAGGNPCSRAGLAADAIQG